jgi:FAD/FMN-containing dehydrogenase/ferredoxin
MSGSSFFNTHLGVSFPEFLETPRDRAGAAIRRRIPDALWFLRKGSGPASASEPRRTVQLAASLEAALAAGAALPETELQNLRDRIITDSFMRQELDRDQNVYLSPMFTRVLTRAVPDLVFQPRTHREVEAALEWARRHRIGITTRGAGSTALGGAVPNDGGLLLEMSRFDHVVVDRTDGVAVIGAGARFARIHAQLAAEGLALKTFPSNLGGTLAGWFSAGGLGLNGFAHGNVSQQVRALTMVLPRGEHVRFHDDGRLDVLSPQSKRLTPEESGAWLETRGYPAMRLADLAQREGQLGVILSLSVEVQPLPAPVPFFFEFETEAAAIGFANWVATSSTDAATMPATLKFLSAGHVAAVRRLRGPGGRPAKASVYVDFESAEAASGFESRLSSAPPHGNRDDAEAQAWFGGRFRPQATKRFGPAYLASEIVLPATELGEFTARATALAARVGMHLETEAYYYGKQRVLVIAGFASSGPRRGFTWELLLPPVLLDLAMRRHGGAPYVLGRWQSPYFARLHGRAVSRYLRAMKKRTDRESILNRGVYFAPAFRSPVAQSLYRTSFPGTVRLFRGLYGSPLTAWLFRALIGARAAESAAAAAPRVWRRETVSASWRPEELAAATRGCVNCGECNAVCPVFHDAKIRLPQLLTHLGSGLEPAAAKSAGWDGRTEGGTPQLLLDLCMRCGNCQEACQADIPHLPLYAAMERLSGPATAARHERQVAILAHLRHSEGYLREFLGVRPGGYVQRTPASLPGEVRYVLFRSENDAGPADTCVHCSACVGVCPTHANLEFEAEGDARRITTDLNRCIGCGTCVEVCPANQKNGGRTLRVMEAPSREFFDVLAAFTGAEKGNES